MFQRNAKEARGKLWGHLQLKDCKNPKGKLKANVKDKHRKLKGGQNEVPRKPEEI